VLGKYAINSHEKEGILKYVMMIKTMLNMISENVNAIVDILKKNKPYDSTDTLCETRSENSIDKVDDSPNGMRFQITNLDDYRRNSCI